MTRMPDAVSSEAYLSLDSDRRPFGGAGSAEGRCTVAGLIRMKPCSDTGLRIGFVLCPGSQGALRVASRSAEIMLRGRFGERTPFRPVIPLPAQR